MSETVDPGTKDVHEEIAAMSAAYEALRTLPKAGQERAVNWLTDKLGVDPKENQS